MRCAYENDMTIIGSRLWNGLIAYTLTGFVVIFSGCAHDT